MFSPIKTLFTYFPLTFFLRVLFLLAIDVVTAVVLYKRFKKDSLEKSRAIAIFLLVFYTTIVLFFTVLCRRTLEYYRFGPDMVSYYTALFEGSAEINMIELWLNILMFVPIGILSCFVFRKLRMFWAVAIGLCTSLVIELLQLVFRSGFVSSTDFIHNTLGAVLGGLLGIVVILIIKIIGAKSVAKVKKNDSV